MWFAKKPVLTSLNIVAIIIVIAAIIVFVVITIIDIIIISRRTTTRFLGSSGNSSISATNREHIFMHFRLLSERGIHLGYGPGKPFPIQTFSKERTTSCGGYRQLAWGGAI